MVFNVYLERTVPTQLLFLWYHKTAIIAQCLLTVHDVTPALVSSKTVAKTESSTRDLHFEFSTTEQQIDLPLFGWFERKYNFNKSL